MCSNYFNIEYTVNNSDTEGGENPSHTTHILPIKGEAILVAKIDRWV